MLEGAPHPRVELAGLGETRKEGGMQARDDLRGVGPDKGEIEPQIGIRQEVLERSGRATPVEGRSGGRVGVPSHALRISSVLPMRRRPKTTATPGPDLPISSCSWRSSRSRPTNIIASSNGQSAKNSSYTPKIIPYRTNLSRARYHRPRPSFVASPLESEVGKGEGGCTLLANVT